MEDEGEVSGQAAREPEVARVWPAGLQLARMHMSLPYAERMSDTGA